MPRPVPPVHPTRSDETPTIHTQRKKRRWFLGGFGAFLLVAGSLGGAWLASAQSGAVRSLAGKLRVPVASASPLRWQVFASGTLPPGVDPFDRASVTADETVRRACGMRSFRRANPRADVRRWAFSVQPGPRGDRRFHCLAAPAD
jgi:hypothetical protein